MMKQRQKLQQLLSDPDSFLYLPSVYDGLLARLVTQCGVQAAYVGGYVTGGSRAVSEPLLTLTEQVETAAAVAQATDIPVLCDAGAGFGEPLHVTRTVAEFIRAGIAGIHLEDQLFPKRAHYHKYVTHVISRSEFRDKIAWACKTRDELDPDFVIIARTDACRYDGFEEAVARINMCQELGADCGLMFPSNDEQARQAPKACRLPLIYVQSRGNRENRPLYNMNELKQMGYKGCIDAQLVMLTALHHVQKALQDVLSFGDAKDLDPQTMIDTRQLVEDLIGLDRYYDIEAQTVEDRKPLT